MKTPLVIVLIAALIPLATMSQVIDTAVHVRSIYFGGGNNYIDPIQHQDLYEWLDSFPQIEQYEIIIQSHTDNIGSAEFNKRLSERRSQSVFEKLMGYNLVPEAIEIKDFGEFLPTYRNDTYHGRLANRRSDVILKPLSL